MLSSKSTIFGSKTSLNVFSSPYLCHMRAAQHVFDLAFYILDMQQSLVCTAHVVLCCMCMCCVACACSEHTWIYAVLSRVFKLGFSCVIDHLQALSPHSEELGQPGSGLVCLLCLHRNIV